MNGKAVSALMRAQLYIPEQNPEQLATPAAQQAAPAPAPQEFKEAAPEQPRQDFSKMQAVHAGANGNGQAPRKTVTATPHVGRNEPCPCGSGLKYKNCHGKGL